MRSNSSTSKLLFVVQIDFAAICGFKYDNSNTFSFSCSIYGCGSHPIHSICVKSFTCTHHHISRVLSTAVLAFYSHCSYSFFPNRKSPFDRTIEWSVGIEIAWTFIPIKDDRSKFDMRWKVVVLFHRLFLYISWFACPRWLNPNDSHSGQASARHLCRVPLNQTARWFKSFLPAACADSSIHLRHLHEHSRSDRWFRTFSACLFVRDRFSFFFLDVACADSSHPSHLQFETIRLQIFGVCCIMALLLPLRVSLVEVRSTKRKIQRFRLQPRPR
jgi:hypothetical protein